jgi:hypothetical protein
VKVKIVKRKKKFEKFSDQFVVEHRVVARREMAVVIDERRVLRKSLFDRRRTFNQNRTDRSGHGDATLTHILIKVREIRKLDAIKLT